MKVRVLRIRGSRFEVQGSNAYGVRDSGFKVQVPTAFKVQGLEHKSLKLWVLRTLNLEL